MHCAALLLLASLPALAPQGVLPADRSVDWSVAGYPGELPRPTNVVDASTLGAVGDGVTPAQGALAAAVAALGGQSGVVWLPPGTYRITGSVALKSGVVLRGAGAAATRIACDLPSSGTSCLVVSGATVGAPRAVQGGLAKGSTELLLADTSGLAPGDWAELRENNGAWDTQPADWAKKVVGQIVQLLAVGPGSVTLAHPLRTTYDVALAPELIKVAPAQEVGVEALGIDRLSDPNGTGGGNNIQLTYAVRSWVVGVDSQKSIGSHVGVFRSSQLTVYGSVFEDAFTFDGSATRGYGVTLNDHSGECLIEGNVFGHLRHAMMVKTGANGNVFAYNWSRDPHRSEPFQDFAGDISVHGHWPYANLFEGNVVSNIIIDQTWGPAGPHNTFFRNRAEMYGVIITPDAPSNDQNFVGNEVTQGKTDGLLSLYYTMPWGLKGTGHFAYGNNVVGKTEPAGTSALADVSYYRTGDACPLATGWPGIGYPNALKAHTVRAETRGKQSSGRTTRPLWVDAGPDLALAEGDTASLTGDAGGGSAPLSAAWSPEAGLLTPGALVTEASPPTSAVYTLAVTDADGCTRSDSVKATVTGTVATPTLSPAPGTYLGPLWVSASCATADSTLRVTTDGSEPTEADPLYDGPLLLEAGATVRARGFKVDFAPSAVAEATYGLDPDECASGDNDCAEEALCTNTLGSYTCECPVGYDGDGTTCSPWPAGDTCDGATPFAGTTWSGDLSDAHVGTAGCVAGVDVFLALSQPAGRLLTVTLTPDAETRVGLEVWADCEGACGELSAVGESAGEAVWVQLQTGTSPTLLRLVGLNGASGALDLVVDDVTPEPVDADPSADVVEGGAEDASAGDASAGDASAGDTSAEDASAEDASAEDTSAEDTSAEDTSAEDTSAEDTSAEDASAEDTSAEDTSVAAPDAGEGDAAAHDVQVPSEDAANDTGGVVATDDAGPTGRAADGGGPDAGSGASPDASGPRVEGSVDSDAGCAARATPSRPGRAGVALLLAALLLRVARRRPTLRDRGGSPNQ